MYFYDSVGVTYTSRNVGTGDYFSDTAVVGDMLYFARSYPTFPFHDLTFYVGTQLAATAITVVWEYPKEGVWTTIPTLTDGTNAFQNAGSNSVTFPVPEDFSHTASSMYQSSFPTTQQYIWIRCRITALTALTEGGANSTNIITFKDHQVTCTSEAALTFTDIYDADVVGCWGVVTQAGDKQFSIQANLKLASSDLISEKEQIQIGADKWEVGLTVDASSSIRFGNKNSEGLSYNGCGIQYWTKTTGGAYIDNLYLYGSVFWKSGGSWTSPTLSDIVDIRDSTLSGDYWYFNSGVLAGSYFHRSVYACSYFFYCYTGNCAIDKLYMPYATVSCDGILLGSGNARVDNTTVLSSQKIYRYYGCNVTLVNCTIGNTNWTSDTAGNAFRLGNSPSGTSDLHVYVKYSLDLTVTDENDNPIEGASVTIIDGQGDTIYEPEAPTNNFSGTIFLAFFPTLMDWTAPPAYDVGMVGGEVTMTSGTYNGQVTTVNSGGASGWSGKPYFSISSGISETSATFDFVGKTANVTDSNGEIDQQECLIWDAYVDYSDSWSRQNIDYTDFTLKIHKNGYEDFESKWNWKDLGEAIAWRIALKKKPCNSMHTSVV